MENKQIDLLDVMIILAKHKKFIIIFILIISIFSVIYSLLVPQLWKSTATILPVKDENTSFRSIGGSSLFGLGSGIFGSMFQNSAEELIAIMKSRTFSEDVVRQFELIDYFNIKESDSLVAVSQAVKGLNENLRTIYLDDEYHLIIISIETKDKELSSAIANYHWEKLENYNIKYRMTKEKQKRIFIENRLAEVKGKIETNANALKLFQEKYHTVDLENQTKQLIILYSELIAKKIENDIEFEYLRSNFGNDSPLLKEYELRKIAIEHEIMKLENLSSIENGYSLKLDSLPRIAVEYGELFLDLEIQKKVYEYLYPQYEQAKIEEVKDLPTIEVIDKAIPAGLRSYPKRARICITNFIVALIFAIFISFIIEFFQNNKERYRELLRHISKWK